MARTEPKKTPENEELPPFEKSLEQLEGIVHAIESGDVSLEQSLTQYERGMKLIRHCRSILERAESKIQMLTVDEKGEIHKNDQ